jgi:hypothetical protein
MADDGSTGAGAVAPGAPVDVAPDRTFNLAAVLHPPASADDPAGIEVAGAIVSARVTPDRELHVSIQLVDAEAWLRQPDGTVRLRVTDDTETLLEADRHPPDPPIDEATDGRRGRVIPIRAGRRGPFRDA